MARYSRQTASAAETRPMDDEARWQAVVTRDTAADGFFYYSVSTTGVYCRPSCPSRLALRKNVRFHETRGEAEGAGFRPCKRCKPDQMALAERYGAIVAESCSLIERAEEPLSLATLARKAGMSRYHFHRVFKAVAGVTPKAYASACRARRVRAELSQSRSVTEAIYGSGFKSNARFYASANHMLGMTPSAFRAGGAHATIRFAVGECSLGAILVAATEKGVCAISLGDSAGKLVRDLQDQFPSARLVGGDRDFERLTAKVVGLVERPSLGLDLPLDIRGTAFQRRVWQVLRRIPPGSTISYAELAARAGSLRAIRAVARACASNPIAVAIPCHRVVRTDGTSSGYRWGVARKRALMEREAKE